MRNVTDEVSNPFGMRPPCPHECGRGEDGRRAVFGYGDANADFHVIGDHPGVHGGAETGVPFTGTRAGKRVLDVLRGIGFLEDADGAFALSNCFLSYRYLCCVPEGEAPGEADYREFERFFDAELRAIAADVLVPVGGEATEHVLAEYTAHPGRIEEGMDRLHGREVRGRGFLVVPMKDPSEWEGDDEERIVGAIAELLETDYRRMVDLGRFLPGGDPYLVR